MLERVVAKTCRSCAVTRHDGVVAYVKMPNHVIEAERLYHEEFTAIGLPDVQLQPGDLFTHEGRSFVVASHVVDYHFGKAIRAQLGLFLNNNVVSVIRQVPKLSGQGGLTGPTDTPLYSSIPCRVTTLQTRDNKQLDIVLERFSLMLSKRYPVQVGDRVLFGYSYSDAKVEGIKLDIPGIQVISFDKDPRWKLEPP